MASTLDLRRTSWDDEHPDLPLGATDYEKQEIRRLWREAIVSYQEAINSLVGSYDRLIDGTCDPSPFCNDVQKATRAIAANQALGVALNMAHHRLALAEQENSDV